MNIPLDVGDEVTAAVQVDSNTILIITKLGKVMEIRFDELRNYTIHIIS